MPYLNLPDYKKRYFPPLEKSGRTAKQMFGKQVGKIRVGRGKSIVSEEARGEHTQK